MCPQGRKRRAVSGDDVIDMLLYIGLPSGRAEPDGVSEGKNNNYLPGAVLIYGLAILLAIVLAIVLAIREGTDSPTIPLTPALRSVHTHELLPAHPGPGLPSLRRRALTAQLGPPTCGTYLMAPQETTLSTIRRGASVLNTKTWNNAWPPRPWNGGRSGSTMPPVGHFRLSLPNCHLQQGDTRETSPTHMSVCLTEKGPGPQRQAGPPTRPAGNHLPGSIGHSQQTRRRRSGPRTCPCCKGVWPRLVKELLGRVGLLQAADSAKQGSPPVSTWAWTVCAQPPSWFGWSPCVLCYPK
jgi:hypothetical protein